MEHDSIHAKITPLNDQLFPRFIDYCTRHKFEHDESYLSDDDLSSLSVDEDICLVLVEGKHVVGAYSVMPKRRFRTRIFHVENGEHSWYRELHQNMTETLRNQFETARIEIFMPEERSSIISLLDETGYLTDRFVYVLEREFSSVRPYEFPEEYALTQVVFPDDMSDWAHIRNTAFRPLKGFVEYSEEHLMTMNQESDFLPKATLILKKGGRGVGIIRAARDEQPDGPCAFIGPIAVLPDYQGRGLGGNMLRALIDTIQHMSSWKTALCVNADNEDALQLYQREGFTLTETVRLLTFQI